jgi:hypothetical protein
MSMRAKLHTISGLASELNRDRRTIANALNAVPPDGKVGKYDAWHIATTLRCLEPERGKGWDGDMLPIVRHLYERIPNWKELHRRRVEPMSFEDLHSTYNWEPEIVLTWVRAGMPYSKVGDWNTGKGFMFHPPHVFDWHLFVGAALEHMGDKVMRKRLCLIGERDRG